VTHDRSDRAAAGGFAAVASALERTVGQLGVRGAIDALSHVNQPRGFDCPGCAWPDPSGRAATEFCEQGAKAIAHEGTRAKLTREFFARWSIPQLLAQSDYWLEQQGRLIEPLHRAPGSDGYTPVSWEAAFSGIARVLRGLDSPDQAIFYTSGRTSNEAAFLYQLFARCFGTNNLPDCANLCHESSGVGLTPVIGGGKGTVSLDDFALADAIFVIGQNPGSNHPRMLTALQAAKRRGARIVAINPLRERALVRFNHPQEPLHWFGRGTAIADLYLQVRVGGDVALLQGIAKAVFEEEERRPGRVLDWAFVSGRTSGFAEWRRAIAQRDWAGLEANSGVAREEMRAAAAEYVRAHRVIVCWAMGLTQHKHGVANVQEIVNLLLMRGNIGVPGAGPCPVRGHSNVQGDRTVGITEKPPAAFLDALAHEFDFAPPRADGLDTVAAIRAMHEGRARAFVGMGGNFAVASPDSALTAAALERCDLTVQISTRLNRSHLHCGREAYVLPCLGRTERDVQHAGGQFVTLEDSMSIVQRSEGRREPASPHLLSEISIAAGLARAVLGPDSPVPWELFASNYDRIRDAIERVLPGFEDYNRRVREPGGFALPVGARRRRFATSDGRAHFTVHELPEVEVQPGRLRLTTLRSHDQFNTTIYGHDDRYRGLSGDRRVVLVHADDLAAAGLREGQRVDVTSHFRGQTRCVRSFRLVAYDVPRGCAAAYFPEANPLVAIDSIADGSHTPTYKCIEVSLAPAAGD
jgi:molybdopterin-dependent oxidoreductase alpha subunit